MTAEQEQALRALLADVCTSESADALAACWGRPAPSGRRLRGLRVECDPEGPFVALEVRPWDEHVTGAVDVEWPADRPLSWVALRDRFGPFHRLPSFHDPGEEYGARWSPSSGGVTAYLIATVRSGAVETLTIRRDDP